jgi:hypothetical protein
MARQYAAVAQHGWQLASSGRYGSTQATLRPAAGATWMRRPPAAVTAYYGQPARTTKQVAGGRRRDAASGSCHSTARAASSQRGEAAGGRRDAASGGCHNSVRAATAWSRWPAGAPCELCASKSATVRAGSEFAVDPGRLAVQQCCGVYCRLGARDAAVVSREDSTPVDSLRGGCF